MVLVFCHLNELIKKKERKRTKEKRKKKKEKKRKKKRIKSEIKNKIIMNILKCISVIELLTWSALVRANIIFASVVSTNNKMNTDNIIKKFKEGGWGRN